MHPETIVREKRYGDFVLRFQYVNPTPHELFSEHEPAMIVCRPSRSDVKAAWIIMLTAAWKYVDDPKKGTHSEYMVHATRQIERMLQLGDSVQTRFKIAEAILDNLEDLLNMPPFARESTLRGDVILKIGEPGQAGSVQIEQEVRG